MASKILVTLGVLVYAVVVPILEINASHVFHPDWPPHARFHDVWQLFTNSAIGVFCLWLTWIKGKVRIPAILGILIMGGVIFAHVIESTYGGSIVSGNFSNTVLGIQPAAMAPGLVVITSAIALFLDREQYLDRKRQTSNEV